jgi:Protein of unknown function (DUF2924)
VWCSSRRQQNSHQRQKLEILTAPRELACLWCRARCKWGRFTPISSELCGESLNSRTGEAQSFRTLKRLSEKIKFGVDCVKSRWRKDWLFGANRAMCVVPGEGAGCMKSTISPKENDRSQNELDSLRALKPDQLAERWRELYGTAMPVRLRRSLIIQALAYRLQEKAFGGLKPATRRLLETAAGRASEHRTAKSRTRRSAQTGTVLSGVAPSIRSRCSKMGSCSRENTLNRSRRSRAKSPAPAGLALSSSA